MFSWIWTSLAGILDYLGLTGKTGKLLFLGLDNAGKTTLLRLLKDDRIVQHSPTYQSSNNINAHLMVDQKRLFALTASAELSLGGIRFLAYDMGGHEFARRLWREYFCAVDAVVFIIDVSDLDRIREARDELNGLLADECIAQCPIMILGNKIDKAGALSEVQMKHFLGLQDDCTGKEKDAWVDISNGPGGIRPMEVFMSSLIHRQGYGEGFRWLAQYLK